MFVLLLACINVGNLLLARGADRRRELSVRTALGAGRVRVVRQLLTESLLLSLAGALASIPLAWAGVHLMRTSLPARIQRFVVGWDQMDIDGRALLFTAAAAVASTLLFGLLPSLSASTANPVLPGSAGPARRASAGVGGGSHQPPAGGWEQQQPSAAQGRAGLHPRQRTSPGPLPQHLAGLLRGHADSAPGGEGIPQPGSGGRSAGGHRERKAGPPALARGSAGKEIQDRDR